MRINLSKLNGLLIAVLICCSSFAFVFQLEGVVPILMISVTGLLIVCNAEQYSISRYKYSYTLIGYILSIFAVNIAFHNEVTLTNYFLSFICYGIPCLLLPINNVSFREVIKWVYYLAIVFLVPYLTYDYGYSLLEGNEGFDSGVLMTTAYRILPLLVATLLYYVYQASSFIAKFASACVLIAYTLLLLVVGSRGAILSLGVLVLLLYIKQAPTYSRFLKRLTLIISLVLLLILSFTLIIEFLYETLSETGYSFLALERLYYSVNSYTSMSSGRTELYRIAMEDFWSSPIIGNGIGSFDNYSGIYPHNIFIQLLQEGGVCLFIPLFIIFIYGLISVLSYKKNSYYTMLMFCFCAGVIQLMFSSHLWMSHFFWLFIFLIINKNSIVAYENTHYNWPFLSSNSSKSF